MRKKIFKNTLALFAEIKVKRFWKTTMHRDYAFKACFSFAKH